MNDTSKRNDVYRYDESFWKETPLTGASVSGGKKSREENLPVPS